MGILPLLGAAGVVVYLATFWREVTRARPDAPVVDTGTAPAVVAQSQAVAELPRGQPRLQDPRETERMLHDRAARGGLPPPEFRAGPPPVATGNGHLEPRSIEPYAAARRQSAWARARRFPQ